MALIPLLDRLRIESSGFEEYNHHVVHFLLRKIYIRTVNDSRQCEFHLPQALVSYWTNSCPMCTNAGDFRMIFLATKNDYWCQWIYQFSHEICHHVINGLMEGELKGLFWFEETLCEVNALYQLLMVIREDCGQIPELVQFVPSVQGYLNGLLLPDVNLRYQYLFEGGLRGWIPLLSQPVHHREHNSVIAALILPLFVENPRLWGILSHIGDSRSYATIDDLFAHLRATADDSYRESLEKMIALLLP